MRIPEEKDGIVLQTLSVTDKWKGTGTSVLDHIKAYSEATWKPAFVYSSSSAEWFYIKNWFVRKDWDLSYYPKSYIKIPSDDVLASSKIIRDEIIKNTDYLPKSMNLSKEELKTVELDWIIKYLRLKDEWKFEQLLDIYNKANKKSALPLSQKSEVKYSTPDTL